jgi:uncharacterized protein
MKMSVDERKPFFRFNPNSYERGDIFVACDIPCDICKRPCIWQYRGIIYAAGNIPEICAGCIADGSLGKFLNRPFFSLHDITIDDADPELENELMQRTPGVPCFNPFSWPVLDGKPLAFLSFGEDANSGIFQLPEVKQAIALAYAELGWDDPEPGPYILLFKEIDGDRYQAVIDLD